MQCRRMRTFQTKEVEAQTISGNELGVHSGAVIGVAIVDRRRGSSVKAIVVAVLIVSGTVEPSGLSIAKHSASARHSASAKPLQMYDLVCQHMLQLQEDSMECG